MGSFREFLAKQKKDLPVEEMQTGQVRDEWLSALKRLCDEVLNWLELDDPDRILKVEETTTELRELKIGSYQAPGLLISLGARDARLVPIARFVAGAQSATGSVFIPRTFGRVDLTNGLDKYMIFRTDLSPQGRWKMIQQDGYVLSSWDKGSFENALQRLLE